MSTQQSIPKPANAKKKSDILPIPAQSKSHPVVAQPKIESTLSNEEQLAQMRAKREASERMGSTKIIPESIHETPPPPPVQPKLTIGQPGDMYEQEADRVARQVVDEINAPPKIQPQEERNPMSVGELKPSPLDDHPVMRVQRHATGGEREASPDLESSIQRARGGGQPLDDGIRERMEGAFGADFSGVRVHTDGTSDQLNQSIQAKAFTTGQDVFFRQGAYEPGSRGGQELLAHELTHVEQQSGGNTPSIQKDGPITKSKKRHLEELDHRKNETVLEELDRRSNDDTDLDKSLKLLRSKSNDIKTFKQVADLLHSFNSLINSKIEIQKLIEQAFENKPWRKGYLLSILSNGQPTPAQKLVLSLGLITHINPRSSWFFKPGDSKEFIQIIETTDWAQTDNSNELKEITKDDYYGGEFKARLKDFSRTNERVRERVEAFLEVVIPKDENRNNQKKVEAEINYLRTIVKHYSSGLRRRLGGVDFEGLVKGIKQWLNIASIEAIQEAANEKLRRIINELNLTIGTPGKKIHKLTGADAGKLSEANVNYLLDLVIGKATGKANYIDKIDDKAKKHRVYKRLGLTKEDLKKQQENWEQDKENALTKEERKEVEEKQQKTANLKSITELHALIRREQQKYKDKRILKYQHGTLGHFRYRHRKLKAHIEKMSNEQRQQFLVSLLPIDAAVLYWKLTDSDQDRLAKKTGREEALKLLEKELKEAKLKDKELADILALFKFDGGAEDSLGNAYRGLVRIVAEEKNEQRNRYVMRVQHKVMSLVTKLRGDEFRQVREDKEVWEWLQDNLDEHHKKKVLDIFGLEKWDEKLAGETREERSEKAKNQAEDSPAHWAQLIDRKVDQHSKAGVESRQLKTDVNLLTVPEGKILGLLQQAQIAAKRQHPRKPSDQGENYHARRHFAQNVLSKLSPRTCKFLQYRMNEFYDQFHKGKDITIEYRLKYTKRGNKARKREDEILTIIEESSGKELLDLSNFREFCNLWKEKAQYNNQEEKGEKIKAVNEKINTFEIDLNEDILKRLEKRLKTLRGKRTKSLVKIVGKARRKIAKAMTEDSEFKKLVMESGMAEGNLLLMQERLMALALLDDEDMRKRGIKWQSLSVKHIETKESLWAYKGAHAQIADKLGSNRYTGGSEKDEENREQVIKKGVEKARKSREEWSRRQENFKNMKEKYNNRLRKLVHLLISLPLAILSGIATVGIGPFFVFLIFFGVSVAQKAIQKFVDNLITGDYELTFTQLLQEFIDCTIDAVEMMGATPPWRVLATPEILKGLVGNPDQLFSGPAGAGVTRMLQNIVENIVIKGPTSVLKNIAKEENPLETLRQNPQQAIEAFLEDTLETGLGGLQIAVQEAAQEIIPGLSEQAEQDREAEKPKSSANRRLAALGWAFRGTGNEVIEEVNNQLFGISNEKKSIVSDTSFQDKKDSEQQTTREEENGSSVDETSNSESSSQESSNQELNQSQGRQRSQSVKDLGERNQKTNSQGRKRSNSAPDSGNRRQKSNQSKGVGGEPKSSASETSNSESFIIDNVINPLSEMY